MPTVRRRERALVRDENRRVEIRAVVTGDYQGTITTGIDNFDFSQIDEYSGLWSNALRNNPDFTLVVEVLVSPASMEGPTRRVRNYKALNLAMDASNAIADSLRRALPDYSDRVFAWGDTASFPRADNRVKVFLSADRIVYTPTSQTKDLLTKAGERVIEDNPPTVKVFVSYPCNDSRERTRSWKLSIAPKNSSEHFISWSGSGPPDEVIVQKWDFRNAQGRLIDFRESYVARMEVVDSHEGAISRTSRASLRMRAGSSKHTKKTLITIFEFDRTDPLSRVMVERLTSVADEYILQKEYIRSVRSSKQVVAEHIFQGHTCQLGSEEYNDTLSMGRAEIELEKLSLFINHDNSRLTRLCQATGVPKDEVRNYLAREFQHKGFSFSEPLADPRTPEGRTINRRTYLSITSYEIALSLSPGDKRMFWLAQAESLGYASDGQGMIVAADSVLSYNPDAEMRAMALRLKGEGYMLTGNFAMAENMLAQSYSLDSHPLTAVKLAEVQDKLGKKGEAKKTLSLIASDDADAAYTLAEMYFTSSEFSLAKKYYEIAIDIRPGINDAECKLLACLIILGEERDSQRRPLEKLLDDCRKQMHRRRFDI